MANKSPSKMLAVILRDIGAVGGAEEVGSAVLAESRLAVALTEEPEGASGGPNGPPPCTCPVDAGSGEFG